MPRLVPMEEAALCLYSFLLAIHCDTEHRQVSRPSWQLSQFTLALGDMHHCHGGHNNRHAGMKFIPIHATTLTTQLFLSLPLYLTHHHPAASAVLTHQITHWLPAWLAPTSQSTKQLTSQLPKQPHNQPLNPLTSLNSTPINHPTSPQTSPLSSQSTSPPTSQPTMPPTSPPISL